MARRYYSSVAVASTLSAALDQTTTQLTFAANLTGWPTSYPFTAVIDGGSASEEIVEVTANTGVGLYSAVRGVDGSTAKTHASGATVTHDVSARDYDEPNSHVNSTSGVHGVTGSIVDTGSTQTLSNKTLVNSTVKGVSYPIGFALLGTVVARVGPAVFIAPVPLSISGFYAILGAGSGATAAVLVNGSQVGSASLSIGTVPATVTTFAAPVAVAAGDRVGVQILTAGSAASDLSVSVQAVTA